MYLPMWHVDCVPANNLECLSMHIMRSSSSYFFNQIMTLELLSYAVVHLYFSCWS